MGRTGTGSWWQNPWAWGGCGCCLGCLAIPLFLFGVIGIGTLGVVKSADVYREAAELAKAHPLVLERFGEPLETGWQIQGSINLENSEGAAKFSVPISGPLDEGTLYVEARKRDGDWEYQRLEVRTEDGTRLQLLDDQPLKELPAEAVPLEELPFEEPPPSENVPESSSGSAEPRVLEEA